MSWERIFLFATGLVYFGFGVAYLVAPVATAELADLGVATPLAKIEIRGFYGGQLIGLGGLILLGVGQPGFARPALWLVVASLGGTALGRIAGIASEATLPPIIAVALAFELGAAAIAAYLLARR